MCHGVFSSVGGWRSSPRCSRLPLTPCRCGPSPPTPPSPEGLPLCRSRGRLSSLHTGVNPPDLFLGPTRVTAGSVPGGGGQPQRVSPGLTGPGCFLTGARTEAGLFLSSCRLPNLWCLGVEGSFVPHLKALIAPFPLLTVCPPRWRQPAARSPSPGAGFVLFPLRGGGSSAPPAPGTLRRHSRAPSAPCSRRGWAQELPGRRRPRRPPWLPAPRGAGWAMLAGAGCRG